MMSNDDNDDQMIFGDLKFPNICLTGEEKPGEKPHPGNLSRPRIEPGPAAWQARLLPLAPQRWTSSMVLTLIFCKPNIQGGPPLCFYLVFWSTVCCFANRHLTHGHLDPNTYIRDVDSSGPLVIILDTGSEVRGLKPSRGFFSERKIPKYDFFRKGSKARKLTSSKN